LLMTPTLSESLEVCSLMDLEPFTFGPTSACLNT
jgi:hypothetical protein